MCSWLILTFLVRKSYQNILADSVNAEPVDLFLKMFSQSFKDGGSNNTIMFT